MVNVRLSNERLKELHQPCDIEMHRNADGTIHCRGWDSEACDGYVWPCTIAVLVAEVERLRADH
jgi:hypothetical protein